ncbi:TetR/AcrR family transcriptional regulator [Streptomyces sp. A7024]|uniref:TetR/AcrR family transcriptional regulator n=1 Tax=Streptomyces coryli TaxID=1128680 RepID=A0A6G4U0M1_9ACTN|nr:TetR/AcrR family transcriptional regulator [Streptomyces coryli]NGN65256.1 TetR/AcrR family transcriptional regulator [Streptomyces coryli]
MTRTRTRRRLGTVERREQLLAVGAELFAEQPYDDVWIGRVAEIAGVSRGLLYHYFPNKRDFFAAVVAHEGRKLMEQTAYGPEVPVEERLTTALDVYLRFAEEHPQGFRAVHRAAAASDPDIARIYEELLAAQEQRMTDALAAGPAEDLPPAELRLAVRGWLSFFITVTLDWLDRPDLPREQVRELCARTLLGAVGR